MVGLCQELIIAELYARFVVLSENHDLNERELNILLKTTIRRLYVTFYILTLLVVSAAVLSWFVFVEAKNIFLTPNFDAYQTS